MRIFLIILLTAFCSLTSFGQAKTITDSLAAFGKVYLVVVEKAEKIPDTIVVEGKKYIAVPSKNPQLMKDSSKTVYIVTNAIPERDQALDLDGKIYIASSEIVMADIMRSNGKIYVVVSVLVLILAGFFIYLIVLDKKVKKIEE